MKKVFERLYRNSIVRYVFFGGCTTLVNLISFYVFRKAGIKLHIANVLSIVTAILFAYWVNSRYVFQDVREGIRDHVRPFLRFISARLATMVIEVAGVWLFVDVLHIQEMIGKFITQFVVIVLNYVLSKLFVFRNDKES